MKPAADPEIRAHRRPGVIVLSWLTRLVAAWVVASPLVAVASAVGVDRLPDGDAELFAPGGQLLVEAVRLGGPGLGAALKGASVIAVLAGWASLLPLAALMVALATTGRLRLGSWLGRSAELFPRFTLLGGLTLALQGLVVLVTSLVVAGADTPAHAMFDERNADLARGVVATSGVVGVMFFGVVQDLARAAVVRHDSPGWTSWKTAATRMLRRPGAPLLGWLPPALWSLALVVLGMLVTDAIDVSQGGGGRVACVLLVHQLTVLGLVALRASWLARALVLATPGAERPADTAAGSDALGGPIPGPAA